MTVWKALKPTPWYIFFVNGKYRTNQAVKSLEGVGKTWRGEMFLMKGGSDAEPPFVSVKRGDRQTANTVVKK